MAPTNGGQPGRPGCFPLRCGTGNGSSSALAESESDHRDADARASPLVFAAAAATFADRKSLRKSAHLDLCESQTSGSPQCRERFRLFLGRRRIDATTRRGSLARIRRRERAALKKPH
ncbi:hypothetical protein CSC73_00950 [Pseudoxanthomonas sacheonensis]|nr:hypothetical protein CSC73_00950 [Pseudoxanthomonas sacheonensis]